MIKIKYGDKKAATQNIIGLKIMIKKFTRWIRINQCSCRSFIEQQKKHQYLDKRTSYPNHI